MKVPFEWLKDYVKIDISCHELAEKLDKAGIKVENILYNKSSVEKIVAGKIIEFKKHPDADRLNIATVDTGEEKYQIITAASNVKQGNIIPVALVGAVLCDGTKIGQAKLKGIESFGMMCSAKEIGITGMDIPKSEMEGVMILGEDVPLGTDIKEIFGLNEPVIIFEVSANRPDCLSVWGIAVETAAVLCKEPVFPEIEFKESQTSVLD